MILHFSHIGLTEGRTFTLVSLFFSGIWQCSHSAALATGAVAATVLGSAAPAQ
jgi:predicted Rossmann fold nucleotide-binding protein DprA/Smf involved in DNA uptake